jgi:hypothetical protein
MNDGYKDCIVRSRHLKCGSENVLRKVLTKNAQKDKTYGKMARVRLS